MGDYSGGRQPVAPVLSSVIPKFKNMEEIVDFKGHKDKGLEGFSIMVTYEISRLDFMHSAFIGGIVSAKTTHGLIESFIEEEVDEEAAGDDPGGDAHRKNLLRENMKANADNIMSIVGNILHYFKLKRLEESHMSNLFAALGLEDTSSPKLVNYMNSLRPFIPKMDEITGFLSIRFDNNFTIYRETLVSWPSLLQRCYVNIHHFLSRKYNLKEIDGRSPDCKMGMEGSDMAIMAAFLESVDKLPGKWYQGQRAILETPPAKYALWIKIFKKIAAKEQSILDDTDNLDLDAFINKVKSAFK